MKFRGFSFLVRGAVGVVMAWAAWPVLAVEYTWDGGGNGSSWSDPLNWTADSGFPGPADTAIFDTGGTVNLDAAIPNGFVSATVVSGQVSLNNLANAISVGNFIVQSNATLSTVADAATSGLGSADVILDGGTLEFQPGVITAINGLQENWYNVPGNPNLLEPLTTANANSLLNQIPVTVQPLDIPLNFPDDGSMNTRSGGQTGADDIGALWLGKINIGVNGSPLAAGDISFGTESDDGSVLYIDTNDNGVFELPGERVVNNNGNHGVGAVTGTTNVMAGTYRMAIGFYEDGGGAAMRAGFFQGVTNDFASLTLFDPSDAAQADLLFYEDVPSGNLANNLTVNSNSTMVLSSLLPGATMQDLTMNGDVELSVVSEDTAQRLTFSGAVSVSGNASFGQTGGAFIRLPAITESGASSLTQHGDGCVVLTAANTYSGVTTVHGGVLEVQVNGGLGDIANGTTVHTNGALVLDGSGNLNYTDKEPLVISGPGNSKMPGAFAHKAGNNDQFHGPITLAGDATIYNPDNEFSLYDIIDNAGYELTLRGEFGNMDIERQGGIQGTGDVVADGINGRIRVFDNTDNTFDGLLTINNIVWDCYSADALGTTNGATIVNSGGRLELRDGRTWGDDITIHGDDNGQGAIRQENNLNTLTGTITLGAPAMIHANFTQLTIEGDITGPYNLVKRGFGALILDGDKTVDNVTLVEGTLQINSANGLGSTAELAVPADATLALADGLALDGSSALQTLVLGGGMLSSVSGTNSISLPLLVDPAAGVRLGGAGDLVVDSSFGASGIVTNFPSSGLTHFGFHTNDVNALNLDNNGGLLNSGNPTNLPTFFGQTLLTIGPEHRGLNFDSDADFIAAGAVGQENNYQNLWIGYLNCDETGTWELRRSDDDDQAGIWLDLNTNGVFESSLPQLGSDLGEQLQYDGDAGWKLVNLTNGVSYLVAFTHREGGGNSRVEFQFRRPGSTFERVVHPLAQAGLWSPWQPGVSIASNSLQKQGTGTAYLNGVNRYDQGTEVAGGLLVPVDENAIGGGGRDVTIRGGSLGVSGGVSLNLGTLEFAGPGADGQVGAITNLDGDNVLVSTNLVSLDTVLSRGLAVVGSEAGTLTIDAPDLALGFAGLGFGGDGDIVFIPDILTSETTAIVASNQMYHFGFHDLSDAGLDLDQNGGLMAGGNPRFNPEYFSETVFTNGPDGGLRYDGDNEFRATGAIGRNDNYSNLFLAQLNCNQSGTWGFRRMDDDDRAGIWIDLDQDGVFESSQPGFGSDRGEQLSWEDGNNRTADLVAGEKYLVAFTHHEFGGSSRVEFGFTPPGGTEVRINPSDPAQAGLWNLPDLAPLNRVVKDGAGMAWLTGANSHIGETEINGGMLVITQATGLGTGAGRTAVNGGVLALDGGVTLVGETIALDGDIIGLSGTNAIAATSPIVVASNAVRVGIGTLDGQLTVDPDIDLVGAALWVDSDGDTVINGMIDGIGSGTSTLPPPLPAIYDFNSNTNPVYDISGWTVGSGFAGAHTLGGDDGSLSAGRSTGDYAHDNGHPTCLVSSPRFVLDGSGDPITFNLQGGTETGSQGANTNELPANVADVLAFANSDNMTGVQGVGLRRVDTGDYVWTTAKAGNGGEEQFTQPTAGLEDTVYVLDFFDYYDGGWGWISLDDVVIPGLNMGLARVISNRLVKAGIGTLQLNANNTYDGGTVVEGGILMAAGNSATGPSNVVVQADGVLAGTGTVGGEVTVETRGTVNAGASPGRLTVGADVSFTDYSSVWVSELQGATVAGVDYDQLSSSGGINLNNATLLLQRDPAYTPVPGEVLVIGQSTTGITGTFNGLPQAARVSAGGDAFVISYLANNITLNVAAGLHPFAGPDTINRSVGESVSIPVSTLLSNDLRGDGVGTLTITSVSSPSLGNGTVTVNAGMVTYTPDAGYTGDDSFTYTMSDGTDTAVGLVTVREVENTTNPAVGNPAGLVVTLDGDYLVAFTGDPDTPYDIEFSTDLAAEPIVWTYLDTVQTDSSGDIEIIHEDPPEPVVYYRAVAR